MKPSYLEKKDVQTFVEHLWDSVFITDHNKKILYWNQALTDLSGYTYEEAIGKPCRKILAEGVSNTSILCSLACPCDLAMHDQKPHETQSILQTKEGIATPILHRVIPYYDDGSAPCGCIHIMRKLHGADEARELIQKLNYMAYIEPLTQTSRRDYGENVLRQALDNFFRTTSLFGVLLLDLDRFKRINDTYGHLAGDHVLVSIVATIKSNLRKSDLLVRYGGDEFLLICPNSEPSSLLALGNKICRLVKTLPVGYNDQIIPVSISIGGTIPTQGDTIDSILERADTYMYDCKKGGGNLCKVL